MLIHVANLLLLGCYLVRDILLLINDELHALSEAHYERYFRR